MSYSRFSACLIAGMLLLLGGCGFHLRGTQPLPNWFNHVAIILEQADSDWRPLLREQLKLAHVNIQDDPAQAQYWLTIQRETFQENILSISSGSSPRQYQLSLRVLFSVQEIKGRELIPPTTLLVTRPITINNDRILGSHDEEAQLKHDMRRDAVTQMLYRIHPLAQHKPKRGQTP